jgi:hypothetical protein
MSRKTKTPYVTVTSEVYGTEQFDYLDEKEAKAGYARLVKSCARHTKEDGIPRTVNFVGVKQTPPPHGKTRPGKVKSKIGKARPKA